MQTVAVDNFFFVIRRINLQYSCWCCGYVAVDDKIKAEVICHRQQQILGLARFRHLCFADHCYIKDLVDASVNR